MSMIELLVGAAIGLIVIAGAIHLFAMQMSGGKRLALETRLNQDLRAAADLVARDLRRASYWSNALAGTVAIGSGSATQQNPYRAVTADAALINYGFSQNVENDELDDAENFGFQLTANGVLQMQTAKDIWQDVTDRNVVRIEEFSITPTETSLPLGDLCPKTCAAGTPNCPKTFVRSFAILLKGRAVADASVVRQLNVTTRMRNDRLEGQCPA
jgi:type IV pilus assembly protein PilW